MHSPGPPTGADRAPAHRAALLQAVFVTLLWSSSWLLIKFGLRDGLPALSFAGLRYAVAFACLLPVVAGNAEHRRTLRRLRGGQWLQLAGLGLLVYAVTQGAQFLSLAHLPAATVSMLLNLTPVLVALFGAVWLGETLSPWQVAGVLASMLGVLLYFGRAGLPGGLGWGLVAALVCLLGNTGSSLAGRRVNRSSGLPPLLVTCVSMGFGGLALLAAGAVTQGLPRLTGGQWAVVGWLALVNTALAFSLWNNSLRTLTAVESSMVNNLMLPQIALLAWLFLGEPQSARQVAGLALVMSGTIVVQLVRAPATSARAGGSGNG